MTNMAKAKNKAQSVPATNKITGFPSVDKPWLRYYKTDAEEKALNTPKDISIYRYYMDNVFTDSDYPVLKYFNRTLTAKQFTDLIETWARAFCAVGIKEDEMVPVYGTWSPEIAAILFALNAIGAYPYYEKLDITADALRSETNGARIGVVFEPMWNEPAKTVFCEDRFEKIFVVSLSDSMRFPLKQLVSLKYQHTMKEKMPQGKFVFVNQVNELASQYRKPFEVPFKKDRIALITSSSGTTSSVVKGIMDTNESAIASILSSAYSEPGLFAGKESLITLPPTASTAINCFFLLPLYMRMTVRIDPRADEDNWTRLLLKYKPSFALNTGSLWYSFYRRVADMRRHNKKVDLSFADTFVMGGSGVTTEQLAFINSIAKECNAPRNLLSGYGCSEFFGVITVDKYEIEFTCDTSEVIAVGIPYPGVTLGIFDDNGNELPYNHRGEIWVKGSSIMHGYFGKAELSKQMLDGAWLKTGDIGEIDENGYLYCFGRKKAFIKIEGNEVFLFDIANALRKEFNLEDCMVEIKVLSDGGSSIVVYYVQKPEVRMDERDICIRMNAFTKEMGVTIDGYREFTEAFPISPTTLKPQTRYTDGFVNFSSSGNKELLSYHPTKEEDVWEKDVLL